MSDYRNLINNLVLFDDDANVYDYLFHRNTAAAFFLLLPRPNRLNRHGNRRCRGTYLTRADLMPSPRHDSAWLSLYLNREDRAFITTMGVDVATFDFLLASGFQHAWETTPIPRGDVNPVGHIRLGARSLDAPGALGLLLHHLCSTMGETALQQIFAIVPSVLSRYIWLAMSVLLDVLRSLPDGSILWREEPQMRRSAAVINRRHPRVHGAFGFLDGLNLPVGASGDPEIEHANYNGWLHAHMISNVIAFAPDGKYK